MASEMLRRIADGLMKHKTTLAVATTAWIGLYMLRRHFAGGVCTSTARLDGKTVIVTGANTGIGRETARELARRGARVILACRDVLKAERVAADIVFETGKKNVVVQQLDLASLESVRKFADRVRSQESRLDILINNAGVMACPEWRTKDGFEMQLGTNHLGHFLLTNLLLDLLRQSAPSRIINVSSLAHQRGKMHFDNINLEGIYEPWKAYGQSKLANVLFTRELARRLKDSGVVAMALHPGAVQTELGRHLPFVFRALVTPLGPVFLKTSWQGAQTTIHCATLTPSPAMAAGQALYFSDCAVKEAAPQAQSDEDARRLWEMSEKMVEQK